MASNLDFMEKQTEQAASALPDGESSGSGPIRLNAAVTPVLNFAMQQNGAAAIQSITIENTTDTPVECLLLRVTAAPEFALPFTQCIDYVPGGKTVTIRPKLILNGEYLAGMTEKVAGVLQIALEQDGKQVASNHMEITVLAFDQWQGFGLYPELLTAFVTPNHPELAKIIARATEFLGKWTGDTSMDGYQSQDPNRVLSQAAAIFTAIKEQAIAYSTAPASFESMGQRVRLCDMVLSQKLGNCLDLTLLYVSCLEAVGLHPLMISTPGHIFTGLWLEEQMFPECVQDDVSLITKRLAPGVNEMAVVETTAVTTASDRSFDDARALGEKNLATQTVEYIIDVRRGRLSGISPLPQRIQTASGWEISHTGAFRKENMTSPAQLEETIRVDSAATDESVPKMVQWERKLLNLGLRNTLINLRLTKTQLPILVGSLDELEDALADGSEYTILPRPAEISAGEMNFETPLEAEAAAMLQGEFQNRRLRSMLTEAELGKTIKELYRTAKTSLEENGANTLYLALGMLRWFENKRSTKARYAPVVLIPIELVRKSAAQGYVIRLRDDEPQMNVTLLEKLKQDFGIVVSGVDPLPMDEHGVDLRRVLTILRKAVMEQPHWDVLEATSIGIFSFSQFVMWNDIRNRADDLLHNKLVRSLMEGKLCWDAKPMEMGEKVSEDNVLLPMPADASQLYAIEAACSGESFVLHGPPGTGKSQTITSLIANALSQGKRVLFVAEKMAALEVVQKRLDSIGIGPFCLELHSNKSKKKDVLEQLRQASEVTKTRPAEEYAAKAEQLAAMRDELDAYARQLHKVLPCGSSLYQLINHYEYYKNAPDIAPFDHGFLESLTKQDIERQRLLVERMIAAAREAGDPSAHPLKRITCTQYSQSLRGDLKTSLDAYISQIQRIQPNVQKITDLLGEPQPQSYGELQRISAIAGCLTCWYDMPPAWAKVTAPQFYFEEVGKLAQHFIGAGKLEEQLLETFDPGFLTQDGGQLYARFAEVSAKWALPKMLGMNKLYKTVAAYGKTAVEKDSLGAHIAALRDYQQERREADALLGKYGQDLGALYNGKDTDWEKIAQLAETARDSFRSLYNLRNSYELIQTYGGRPDLQDAVCGMAEAMPAFAEAKERFDSLLGIAQKEEPNWLDEQLALCRTILAHAQELKEWIAYMAAASEAKAAGLANVAQCCEAGGNPDVLGAYEKALLQGLIMNAIDESGALNQFSGAVFNEKIQQYRRMDKEWTRISREEVYCRLASKVPNFTKEAAHSSELGILQRCIKSGGRGTSIRRLFDQIPNLLPRLCPCMLMSPISAAQYLDPKREPFDIVVFDEASQLPTCKAVGVLARGKEAVIVGDPKQMPPTSFFATNTVDEDNLEAEDLESILDDCLALNMPESHLLWHYRSRHESLIAFSNSQFYENKLLTFPSVNDRESKVRMVHVDGLFDRGKTRTNRAEAEAIVGEVRRRYEAPKLSKQSLGVVTFNISQQHLIDDLLNEACAQDADLEKWVYGGEEPLFIKNLENVQGDERDVILFSVGFGPDETGKVYMNFGPLNRDGGWRRLNVAVSRARCEMVVFSTLRSEQLDLNRTKAEGVAALRSFLEYAEGKGLALEEDSLPAKTEEDGGLAAAISQALAEKGYETDLAVGRSQYHIDIGVVDPKHPETYLLGILLDGGSYEAAKTTRDRELAQISVLEGLGWKLLRVWSMDWWDNRQKELNRILDKLEKIQNGVEEALPEETTEPPVRKLQSRAPQPKAAVLKAPPVYQAAALPVKPVSAEEFIEPRNARDIQKKIQRVIAEEAPVSQAVLIRRVVQSYGITRAGSRIQGHMAMILENLNLKATRQEDMVFYWKQDQEPDSYASFRVSGDGESRRDVRDVPVQEAANAVCTVLYEQVGIGREDLIREAARKLGYTKLGGNVLAQLTLGLRYAEDRGSISLGTNGNFVLTDSGLARVEAALKNV